jgi:hypothetical protein
LIAPCTRFPFAYFAFFCGNDLSFFNAFGLLSAPVRLVRLKYSAGRTEAAYARACIRARAAGWVEQVNSMVAKEELERLTSCVRRSRPFARRRLGAADGAAAGPGIHAARSAAAKKAIARGKKDGFAAVRRSVPKECPRSVPLRLPRIMGSPTKPYSEQPLPIVQPSNSSQTPRIESFRSKAEILLDDGDLGSRIATGESARVGMQAENPD